MSKGLINLKNKIQHDLMEWGNFRDKAVSSDERLYATANIMVLDMVISQIDEEISREMHLNNEEENNG